MTGRISAVSRQWRRAPRPLQIAASRAAALVPQLFAVTFVTFGMVRLLPGDPALLLLGNMATPDAMASLRARLGLDRSVWEQFLLYLDRVLHGDLGISIFTSQPVVADLAQRAPATLELVACAMLATIIIAVPVALASVVRIGGAVDRGSKVYGLVAGALPDFWVALLLIYLLFHLAGIAAPPFGRIDNFVSPPTTITGFYTVDSLLSGNMEAFLSAAGRLILPVTTIAFVNAGALMKLTRAVFEDAWRSEYAMHARASGLSERTIIRIAFRNSLPPLITLVGFMTGFLLGAAVLVETIFAWGGLGQYAVQAVVNSDYPALQGFVLVAAAFVLVVYTVVDVLYELVDPRIEV